MSKLKIAGWASIIVGILAFIDNVSCFLIKKQPSNLAWAFYDVFIILWGISLIK